MSLRTAERIAVALIAASCAHSAHSQMSLPSDPTLLAENAKLQIRPSYQKCIDASVAATPALLNCSAEEFAYQDKRLNENYKRLMASLASDARNKLRDEERAWLAEKRQRCSSGDEPGQGDLVVSATCEVTETAKRANDLAENSK